MTFNQNEIKNKSLSEVLLKDLYAAVSQGCNASILI